MTFFNITNSLPKKTQLQAIYYHISSLSTLLITEFLYNKQHRKKHKIRKDLLINKNELICSLQPGTYCSYPVLE